MGLLNLVLCDSQGLADVEDEGLASEWPDFEAQFWGPGPDWDARNRVSRQSSRERDSMTAGSPSISNPSPPTLRMSIPMSMPMTAANATLRVNPSVCCRLFLADVAIVMFA